MIKFTDGKKEYIWDDNNEIIGMDKMEAEMLKMIVFAELLRDNHILTTGVLESKGFKIIEQDEEPEGVIY